MTIQDHASKFGTWLDGAEVKDRTVTATGTSHTLKVAKMPDTLRYSSSGDVWLMVGFRGSRLCLQMLEVVLPKYDN